MTKLTFFHQARADGGIHTGIEIDGATAMESYEQETGDFDPALLWYVDAVCEGDDLPCAPEAARQWFSTNGRFFEDLLAKIASHELDVGYDPEARPLRRVCEKGPDGSRVTVLVSAMHRLQGRNIAKQVRSVAENWRRLLSGLTPYSLV
jgi:hypothetical protein